MQIEIATRLALLATKFDVFILDIWGVLMDGMAPYPGAIECLHEIRGIGKRVILLSNAPRRASLVTERLRSIGIPPTLYDQILTSGEASRSALAERTESHIAALGRQYFYIGPSRDQGLLKGLDYVCTNNLNKADFVLATGVIDDTDELDRYEADLQTAAANQLPLICTNPDSIVVRQNGDRVICAGAIARKYQKIGGTAHYFGKPHATFYQTCLNQLKDVSPNRILAVGDTLQTDIKGAQTVSLTTALVLGGILAKELNIAWGETPAPDRLKKLCANQGISQTSRSLPSRGSTQSGLATTPRTLP